VVVDDNLLTLALGVEEGRRLLSNLKKAVTFYLGCKGALVGLFLVSVIAGYGYPLSSIQVILLECFMDLVLHILTAPLNQTRGHQLLTYSSPRRGEAPMGVPPNSSAGGCKDG
jgi:magnesium-transporting ATPase (P-type)